MSKKLIEMENGLIMEVEIQDNKVSQISSKGDVIKKVKSSMQRVEEMLVQSVKPIEHAYKTLNRDVCLEKAEIEIGIGFTFEGNAFIVKGNSSANLKVKLILSPKKEEN